MVSAFVDGSQIYGPTEEEAALLRGQDGLLLTNSQYSRELLPSINGNMVLS